MKPLSCRPSAPLWFDMRVFYVRISNFDVKDFTPKLLSLNHIPLGLETILEVNGEKGSTYSECVSTKLRRDRVDITSEEATFVNTDNVRITGSTRFEVFDNDDLLLSGVLELCNGNEVNEKVNDLYEKWNIKCRTHKSTATSLMKGKECTNPDVLLPTIEVYVAGCFSGNPIILTETLHLGPPKKHNMKVKIDSFCEYGSSKMEKVFPLEALEAFEYTRYSTPTSQTSPGKNDFNLMYDGGGYAEDCEDGELSWFNAGVRMGVGIGLGVCVGVGLGVGLLTSSYQVAARTFKKRFL